MKALRWFLAGLLFFGGLAFAGLESGTYISDLVASNPVGSDQYSTAANHLRLIKSTIKNTFPSITGPVTLTQAQINAAAQTNVSNTFTALQNISLGSATNALCLVRSDLTNNAACAYNSGSSTWLFNGPLSATSFTGNVATTNLTGTLNNATVAVGNVTQWQGSLSIAWGQITGTKNADQLQGETISATATASSVAGRDAAGDLFVRYANLSAANNENPSISQFMVTNGADNYVRKSSVANAASALQGSISIATSQITSGTMADARIASSNVTQYNSSIIGRNISAKSGTAKTLLASASCPPTGGSDGDIWYCY